jgi:uncharacterized protein (DUF1501 family)
LIQNFLKAHWAIIEGGCEGYQGQGEIGKQPRTILVRMGGFDTHNSATKLTDMMREIDQAIGAFETEMKEQGMWGNVVVVTASDFARTLRSNGVGECHASV